MLSITRTRRVRMLKKFRETARKAREKLEPETVRLNTIS